MPSTFNEQAFEQKLVNLKDTQEAIIGLSTWCLQNRDHHKQIVMCWLHCLKRVKIEARLSLFYLANDVIQHSKRKRYDFVESWGTALQKATPLVRDDKVRERILRIFRIWEERQIYDEAFIADLCGLLTTKVKKKSQVEVLNQNDFQPTLLVRKIKEIKALSENTDLKFKRIKDNKLPLTDAESMRLSLKDRRHGSDVSAEVDSGVKKMEAFVKALETEIGSREKLIDTLREALIFYEKQRGEAKIVANAYRNFGSRLRTQQKSVEELVSGMSSPLPSPDVNAPSPSPDSDFDAKVSSHHSASNPVSNGDSNEFSLVNSSFIGSGHFLDISKEIFASDSKPEQEQAAEAQPIEVIGGREAGANFDVAEFFKSLIGNKEPVLQPPPMPPVFTDWSTAGPWDQPPPETPLSPPLYEKQAPTHEQPLVYDDSLPMVPVEDEDHRTLPPPGPPMELPLIDMDLRLPPPMNMDLPPPPMHNLDIDHRNMPMHAMDVPPPSLSERAAIIPPNADRQPAPVSLLGPPPPPPAMQAMLDMNQRNLIRLTGPPAAAPRTESFHKEAVYIPPVADDYNMHQRNDQPHFNDAPPDVGAGGGGVGGYEPVFPPSREPWNQPDPAPRVNEAWNQQSEPEQPLIKTWNQPGDHEPWLQQREQEPLVNETWNQPPPREEPRVNDIVESIDMDMSEGEDESQTRGGDFGRGRGFHMDRQPPINQGLILGPPAPSDVDHAHHFPGPPIHNEIPVHEPPFLHNEPPQQQQQQQQMDPHHHPQPRPLFPELMSVGAKLVPHPPPNDELIFHNNGFATDSEYDNSVNMRPAPRWQSPLLPRGGQRFNRPHFIQRSPMFRPRQFRPRGRW